MFIKCTFVVNNEAFYLRGVSSKKLQKKLGNLSLETKFLHTGNT